jgi:hypothetical protein
MAAILTVEDFNHALTEKRLAEAADWLETVLAQRADFPEWTDTVLDSRELALFTACCNEGWGTNDVIWFKLAKRVIENSRDMSRILTRRQHLTKISGMVYETI